MGNLNQWRGISFRSKKTTRFPLRSERAVDLALQRRDNILKCFRSEKVLFRFCWTAEIMVTDKNNDTPLYLATLTSLWQNCYFAIGKVLTKRTMTTKRPWKKRKLNKKNGVYQYLRMKQEEMGPSPETMKNVSETFLMELQCQIRSEFEPRVVRVHCPRTTSAVRPSCETHTIPLLQRPKSQPNLVQRHWQTTKKKVRQPSLPSYWSNWPQAIWIVLSRKTHEDQKKKKEGERIYAIIYSNFQITNHTYTTWCKENRKILKMKNKNKKFRPSFNRKLVGDSVKIRQLKRKMS